MFLVGTNVTAADFVVLAVVAPYFSQLTDMEKLALPHAFRWVDHVQHLPGLLEQIQAKGILTSFPDESSGELSKAQQKKLAKLQAAKEAKEAKKGGKGDEKSEKPK